MTERLVTRNETVVNQNDESNGRTVQTILGVENGRLD